MEYLIVDGYNIINAWDELSKISKDSMEDARWKLLEIMSDYQGYTNNSVVVVFDAHFVKDSSEKIEDYDNIKVVYTKENETADNYIEKLVHNLSKDYTVRVATLDYLEQTIVLSKGAYRISASELFEELKRIRRRKRLDKNKSKKNTIESMIDPNTAKILEKLRREEF